MDKLALLQEADRRGILPPEKKALLIEAQRRGLIKGEQDFSEPEKPTVIERLGRGMEDVRQGIVQGGTLIGEKAASMVLGEKEINKNRSEAARYTKEKTDEEALYEKGRGPDAGIDLARLGGNIAATLPIAMVGAPASLAARSAVGATQGATASGLMFTPEGQSKGEQIALGAAVGGAVPTLIEGGRRAVGGTVNRLRPPVVDTSANGPVVGEISFKLQQQGLDWGKLTNDVRTSLLADAKKTLEVGGTLDDVMLKNKALIESVGAQPTRAAVTRAPRDWQAEKNMRPIVGVGEGIVERDQTNAKALTDYLSNLRSKTGGKTGTAIETGESAIGALKAGDAEKEKAVSALYSAFRDSGAQDANVPAAKIADAMGKVADEIGHENIPAAVLNRLKEFGLVDGKQTKVLTVNEADKLNRLINNNNPGHGPASTALGRIKSAVNEALLDVEPAGKQGVEALKTARAAAATRFAEQDAAKGITAAVNDVSPDRFVQKFILGADARELAATKAELMKTPAGKQAMNDVKGHLLDSLLMKSTGATAVDDVIGKTFSGVRFSKALDSIPPEKLHMLFTPDEVGALRNLQKASKLLTEEVPFSDVNHSKTTAALANLLQKIGNTPLLGQIVSPIIGTAKIGMDWVKDAAARKQVAEALVGSAGTAGVAKALPALTGRAADVAGLVPASAAAAFAEPRKKTNR